MYAGWSLPRARPREYKPGRLSQAACEYKPGRLSQAAREEERAGGDGVYGDAEDVAVGRGCDAEARAELFRG